MIDLSDESIATIEDELEEPLIDENDIPFDNAKPRLIKRIRSYLVFLRLRVDYFLKSKLYRRAKRRNFSHLFASYSQAMVRVTVVNSQGDLSNGSAFHIGDGWLVTAKHVVENQISELVGYNYCSNAIKVKRIVSHPDDTVDLALLETDFNLDHYLKRTTIMFPKEGFIKTDQVSIGGHLDDWIGEEFVLTKVLLMGYPIVPFSNSSGLLASEGEVNAVVDMYGVRHPRFIISCMGRGGYSGGPVISEYGFLLGVMTDSLVLNHQAEELGYTSAISVEPLLVMLKENNIYPGDNGSLVKELLPYD